MRHIFAWLLAPVLVAICVYTVWPQEAVETHPPSPAPATIAVVNGKPITEADFQREVEHYWARQILESMITNRLIWDEAARRGITVTRAEVDDAIAKFASNYPDEETFQKSLRERGISPENFRQEVHLKILTDKLVQSSVKVTDEEARAYYDIHFDEYNVPARVHVAQIVLPGIEDGYAVRERLASGEEFATVAADASIDKESASNGGDLGWLTRGDFESPRLADVAFAMEPGQVSAPLDIDGKTVILKVFAREEGHSTTFEQVRDEIIARLRRGKAMPTYALVTGLERKADIRIVDPRFRYLQERFDDIKRIKVYVNGRRIRLERQPVIETQRVLVPIKPLLRAMGANVAWDAGTQTMTATLGTQSVAVTVGKAQIRVGNSTHVMEQPARMLNGQLFAPARAIVEGLGGKIHWDALEYRLSIKTAGEA